MSRSAHWPPVLLGVVTLLLYTFGLSWAPVHLHYDEIRFAEQARSIASTWRDLNGRFLPVYFQMEATVWFHPVGVYLPAIAFKLWDVSTVALRAPSAFVGALDVVLIYFIALRIFQNRSLAIFSGALLMLAPAHFIHSRMAVDYLFPTPFALAWCLALLRALETRSRAALFVAASILGAGCYSYIAAVALMPLFLAVTIVVLWLEGWAATAVVIAVAGFLWPLVPAAWFITAHPEMLASTLGRYGIAANDLDALQRVRELLTPWSISDRANLYGSFFSPGYLFVTGGNQLAESTRTAGVFLAATLPLMLVGVRAAIVRYSAKSVLVLAGTLLPAAAATLVPEPFAVGRAMSMVPFAILLAVMGIEQLRHVTVPPRLFRSLSWIGVATIGVGVLYIAYRAIAGELTPGGLILVGCGLIAVGTGYAVRRSATLQPVVLVLLLACLLQFQSFARDYFGDYRARSAVWFNGNLKGAVERLVTELDRPPARRTVVLDQDVNAIDWYWRFHLAEIGRGDLAPAAIVMTPAGIKTTPLAPGTLLLAPALDEGLRTVAESRGMALVATITDPGDTASGTEPPSYFIFEQR